MKKKYFFILGELLLFFSLFLFFSNSDTGLNYCTDTCGTISTQSNLILSSVESTEGGCRCNLNF
jgi:hypothetical protein